MTQLRQILAAALLTFLLVTVSYGGTITGSRTTAARVGTITGSRTGTITGSRTGTITGSRTGTITGSRVGTISGSGIGRTFDVSDELLSRLIILLGTVGW